MCMLPRRQPYQHPATVVVERQQKEEEEEASLDTSDNWICGIRKDRQKETIRAAMGIWHLQGHEVLNLAQRFR